MSSQLYCLRGWLASFPPSLTSAISSYFSQSLLFLLSTCSSAWKEFSLPTPSLAIISATLFPDHFMWENTSAGVFLNHSLSTESLYSNLQFRETWLMASPCIILLARLMITIESPSTIRGVLWFRIAQVTPFRRPSSSTRLLVPHPRLP